MPTKKGVNEMFTPCSISFCALLLYLRRHLVAQALVACQISLGSTKREEHVKTYGQVVLIIGDVEADELVVLAVLALDEREGEAAVLSCAVLHLQRGLARIFQP